MLGFAFSPSFSNVENNLGVAVSPLEGWLKTEVYPSIFFF